MLNDVLREVKAVWQRRGYGTEVGRATRGERLTHVAFADDCTLIARSWLSLHRMILGLRDALLRRGLRLHPSKCEVQTNVDSWVRRGMVHVAKDFTVKFLAEGSPLTVLGTTLTLQDPTQHEVQHRVVAGWKMFYSLKQFTSPQDLFSKEMPPAV